MTVDRIYRDLLIETIDQYLGEKINAFAFDEAIHDIRKKTSDATVHEIVDILYCFYDDFEDHPVVVNRVGWNYIQRLRLILSTDASLTASKQRIWTATQLIAATAVLAFAAIAYSTGVGSHLWLVAILLGPLSIGLHAWRERLAKRYYNPDVTLYPFNSLAQILWVGRDAKGFRKERYPTGLESRRVRSRSSAFVGYCQMYVCWVMYSPASLVVQMLPVSIPMRRVVLSPR